MDLNSLFLKIDEIIKEKGKIAIAIDGDCCSGKTTLANEISEKYGCEVIHMDDFFLPFELRSEERYNEPGGNFHYERFMKEVLPDLKSGKEFSYGIFDCSVMKINGEKLIKENKVRLVEGSYSMHPKLIGAYDLKIFLSIDKNLQLERIRNRDGEEALSSFIQKWIPFEKKYHEFYNIKEKADIIFEIKM